jgi:hypothetical protein
MRTAIHLSILLALNQAATAITQRTRRPSDNVERQSLPLVPTAHGVSNQVRDIASRPPEKRKGGGADGSKGSEPPTYEEIYGDHESYTEDKMEEDDRYFGSPDPFDDEYSYEDVEQDDDEYWEVPDPFHGGSDIFNQFPDWYDSPGSAEVPSSKDYPHPNGGSNGFRAPPDSSNSGSPAGWTSDCPCHGTGHGIGHGKSADESSLAARGKETDISASIAVIVALSRLIWLNFTN